MSANLVHSPLSEAATPARGEVNATLFEEVNGAFTERPVSSENQEELVQEVRLAHLASKVIMDISAAQSPQTVLARLRNGYREIFSSHNVQVVVGLTEKMAPIMLPASLPPTLPGYFDCTAASTELLCLDLAEPSWLVDEDAEGNQKWFSKSTRRLSRNWGKWDLDEHIALSDCFEDAKEVGDELGPNGWRYAEHTDTMRQYSSVLYQPLCGQGTRMGVIRLAASSTGVFAGRMREYLTMISEVASERLRDHRYCYGMNDTYRVHQAKIDLHRDRADNHRQLLNDMLPEHIVEKMTQVYRGNAAVRRHKVCVSNEPEPEDSPDLGLRRQDRALAQFIAQQFGKENESLRDFAEFHSDPPRQDLRSHHMLATNMPHMNKLSFLENHECVAVLASDIKGFTNLSSTAHPAEIMIMLDDLFSRFDDIIMHHETAYKVETAGDGYVVAFGLTEEACCRRRNGEACDYEVAMLAISVAAEMTRAAHEVVNPLGQHVDIRVGIQMGSVMTGIVGRKAPRFYLFGETKDTASRMESTGTAGKIHVTSCVRRACWQGIRGRALAFQGTGGMEIRGKGRVDTFLVDPDQVLSMEGIQRQWNPAKGLKAGLGDLEPRVHGAERSRRLLESLGLRTRPIHYKDSCCAGLSRIRVVRRSQKIAHRLALLAQSICGTTA